MRRCTESSRDESEGAVFVGDSEICGVCEEVNAEVAFDDAQKLRDAKALVAKATGAAKPTPKRRQRVRSKDGI